MDVLLHLVKNRGRVLSKEELFGACWGKTAVGDNALSRVGARLSLRRRGDRAIGSTAVHGVRRAFVGREHQLSLAIERFQLAQAGQGGACFLRGEAGIGKTRFLLELGRRVSALEAAVLRGESAEARVGSACWPDASLSRAVERGPW